MKLLKYTHPAMTNKFDLKKSYSLDELKKDMPIDEIKVLFSPVNFKWEDLEPKKIIKPKFELKEEE